MIPLLLGQIQAFDKASFAGRKRLEKRQMGEPPYDGEAGFVLNNHVKTL